MDGSRTCQELQWEIGALFACSEHGDHQRIRTPYLYPDGDNIDLFCKVVDDVVTVSDLADTTGWLRMQTAALVCTDEDFRLVEPLSMVSRWSRPDEFSAVLREAA